MFLTYPNIEMNRRRTTHGFLRLKGLHQDWCPLGGVDFNAKLDLLDMELAGQTMTCAICLHHPYSNCQVRVLVFGVYSAEQD